MPRILVVEPIAAPGLGILRDAHVTDVRLDLPRPALLELVAEGGYDALVVRSQTRVDAELIAAAGARLTVVGVASVGTDRIDLDAATRAGVMVVNAPTGNTIAAAEHTLALMLALLRRIPAADASMRRGEWEKRRYLGSELRGRTIGIVGLGKIGRTVARLARAFGMRVLAADPYVTAEQAAEQGVTLVPLDELLPAVDLLTLHTVHTEGTRGLIDAARLAALRPGAFLLNVARGGIVDESALADALRSGHLAGAAIDVYASEPIDPGNPLLSAPNTVLTPHLGASTAEAQDRVATEMAEQVVLALSGTTPPSAVNAPAVAADVAPRLRPYVELGRRLGSLARQLADAAFDRVGLTYAGEIAEGDCAPIRSAALAGLLEAVADQRVNAVNADLVAREAGYTVTETRTDASDPWASLVTLDAGSLRLAGSTAHGRPHLAGLGEFALDAELAGTILVTRHHDQPGIIGAVGTILAAAGINISSLELSRLTAQGEAMMFVSLDERPDEALLAAVRAVPGMAQARLVSLAPLP